MPPSKGDSAGAARVRSRRSFAQMPRLGASSAVDKENMTTDVSAVDSQSNTSQTRTTRDKKLRSKSLGPGGLDALQNGSGNRRKSVAQFPLKSILKPTVPVSPIRAIPSFDESRKRTPARSPKRGAQRSESNPNEQSDLLIDFSTPPPAGVIGGDNLANPFDTFNPSSIMRNSRLAAEQQREAESEKEEREKREQERKAILEQRAARRKSMANRRVSFAPEATLHTWNVVELAEDSTSSSASTNSTRRASSLASDHDPTQGPSSGVTSGAFDDIDDAEAFSSSPYSGSSAADSDDTGAVSIGPADGDSSNSDTDDDGSTVISMDNATQQSMASVRSDGSSTASSIRLERSLRQAARMAGTRGIDYDENGDLSMEFANHEIAGAFKPWVQKGTNLDFDLEDLSSRLDQENANVFTKPSDSRLPAGEAPSEYGEDADMSMDVTKAIGGILLNKPEDLEDHPKPAMADEMSNYGDQTMEFTKVIGGIAGTPSSLKDVSAYSDVGDDEDMTMEFTSVLGGVLKKPDVPGSNPREYDQQSNADTENTAENFSSDLEEEQEMDMTNAVGGILPPIEEHTEPQDDETMGMDMTSAMGRILTPQRVLYPNIQMDLEAEPASSPFQEHIPSSPLKSPRRSPRKSPLKSPVRHIAPVASESGSPSLAAVKPRPGRRSVGSHVSTTPKSSSRQSTPVKKRTTPSKQVTPQVLRPTTPSKTPPSSNIAFRSASPKKLFKPELRQQSAQKTPNTAKSLFQQDSQTGRATPSFVLRPIERRTSGLGIDKEGLGSPKVAAILDRRRSIGEDAQQFVPQTQPLRGVRFDDPRQLEQEVDKELSEESRETTALTGSFTEEHGEKESTLTLREMIQSLTPKKNKLKGRKSLHVGAAIGLLGKRPAELDSDEEEEYSPKRLKGRDASPVKSIKLPAPPSKAETVRRLPRFSTRNGHGSSPLRPASPQKQFTQPIADRRSSQESTADLEADVDDDSLENTEPEHNSIHLQEFLDMTNIHFMELTTTKRRHTLAPDSNKIRVVHSGDGIAKEISLEDCVAAGVCTVPMLELYQHSCRELKSYISEGRQIIRSIEDETYADNPPLFQEYATAPPDIRLLMDNQFRNVKTHARLLSKSMWYEWRMKLLEGLKEGLDRHVEEMKHDEAVLAKREELLTSVVPDLVEKHSKLEVEARNLQQLADEMESCDQEELRRTRETLAAVDAEIATKQKRLEEAQEQLQGSTNVIDAGAELKTEFLAQIGEAERVREECRGWSVKEVQSLKASVHNLECQTGWTILSVKCGQNSKYGPIVSMKYRDELQLDFHPGAFKVKQQPSTSGRRSSQAGINMPLTLSYSPDSRRSGGRGSASASPSPEKALILHALRIRTSHISQASVSPRELLASVSRAWEMAINLSHETRMLGYCGISRSKTVEVKPSEPALLKVRCMLLGWTSGQQQEQQSKDSSTATTGQADNGGKTRARIDVDFTVKPKQPSQASSDEGIVADVGIVVDVSARKVYGFGDWVGNGGSSSSSASSRLSEQHIGEVLSKAIQRKGGDGEDAEMLLLGKGVWKDAVKRLERRVFG
ncbi:hypothetical protein AJ80_00367 [Polytolypa hystricis UAMH7299]|uniref:Spc7 kinetochore protein domain-containing protein n=1 Tax=Polytolypa hystricis (strain UAMH7299) TaxID=1447883 RepID=A0A2B7Z4E0_POLH7|nr:hypothetical protein AJ80_00367 [Polytolypa hystricis UAMH7299]